MLIRHFGGRGLQIELKGRIARHTKVLAWSKKHRKRLGKFRPERIWKLEGFPVRRSFPPPCGPNHLLVGSHYRQSSTMWP